MAKAAEYKKKIVADMLKMIKQYAMVGVVNMENLPASQLQVMRAELRGKVDMFMTKKRLMKIAIEKIKSEKKGIEQLEESLGGMPALIFTNDSPFKLSKILQKSKTAAPARSGQTAPNDITINKGPTPFAPGPVISELSSVGLKVGVENGKVAIKEDSVVAKKGEKIKPKVAEILTRLDIKPMEVGLGLVAAYESGIVYSKDILEIDEKEYLDNLNRAASQAFNLAFNIAYTTKDSIKPLIAKAFNDAKALGLSQEIIDDGIIGDLLGRAEGEMLGLKNAANIEAQEKPKEEKQENKEKVKEENPAEVKKEEPKTEAKPEVKEEPAKKEEKKAEEKPQVKEEAKPTEKEKPKEQEKEEKPKEEPKKPEPEAKQEEPKKEEKKEEKIEIKEIKPEDDIDKKVREMVEKTKKFAKGEEETAADIIEDVKKEEDKEEKAKEEVKEEKPEEKKEAKEEVPSTHDLKKQKEEKDMEDVENLTKELLEKGTLRKKKKI
ncbi:MAG: 50S ribosomal protein L10 [Candidatus Woesearchaeota archaeon]|jgi:large subunit ribosomal protein L10|nr:50S ribosomal protein L10 [Candidatus Woesearchaeota archaeon]|tara:strand:- start:6966 stop:8441 length:1476 start_codon:yes stop_codon:yes gene_type:complete